MRPAAHPQIEFTITIAIPDWPFKARSTASAVRSSSIPRRVNSSRIGITIISGYIVGSFIPRINVSIFDSNAEAEVLNELKVPHLSATRLVHPATNLLARSSCRVEFESDERPISRGGNQRWASSRVS